MSPQQQPPAGWYPQLNGLNLPSQLTGAMTQNFTLMYSLRDAVAELAIAVARQLNYDNHLNRTLSSPQAYPQGALWFESDRPSAFYQVRLDPKSNSPQWFYAAGIHADLLANQPTDLKIHDVGYLFLATDSNQMHRWDGTVWTVVV